MSTTSTAHGAWWRTVVATLPRSTPPGPDQADRADHQEVGGEQPCSLLVVKTT